MSGDINFDDRANRFLKSIYDSDKGMVREAVLRRDLLEGIPDLARCALRILDAGGGAGQMAVWLARQNKAHRVTLCDLSGDLLAHARERIAQADRTEQINLEQVSIQGLAERAPEPFDLITCHAVLEWLADPEETLGRLCGLLKPRGILSLMFFNIHGQAFRMLLNGNFEPVKEGDFGGPSQGLRPLHPCDPEEVVGWLRAFGLKVTTTTGVRTFVDFMPKRVRDGKELEELIDMELTCSRQAVHQAHARYIHILAQAK